MCTWLINLLCPRPHCNHHRLYGYNQGGYYYDPTIGELATANQLANGSNGAFYATNGYINQCGCRRNGNQGGYYYDPVALSTAGQIENGTLTANYYPRYGSINQCGCQRQNSTLAIINCMF